MLPNDRRIDADTLTGFLAAVLTAAGASKPDADCVAAHLADANLKGHDSHGAGLLPVYVHHIRKGLVETEATPSTLTDTAVLLRVDGHGGWGAPAGFNLIERAGHKAKASGLAAATLGHVHHLGRIGAYGERAAAAGLGLDPFRQRRRSCATGGPFSRIRRPLRHQSGLHRLPGDGEPTRLRAGHGDEPDRAGQGPGRRQQGYRTGRGQSDRREGPPDDRPPAAWPASS